MLDNMTLGQYYPADSVLHRMDPRFKIAVAVLFMVVAFLVNTAWGYGMVFVVLAVAVITGWGRKYEGPNGEPVKALPAQTK